MGKMKKNQTDHEAKSWVMPLTYSFICLLPKRGMTQDITQWSVCHFFILIRILIFFRYFFEKMGKMKKNQTDHQAKSWVMPLTYSFICLLPKRGMTQNITRWSVCHFFIFLIFS
jgi:hypothetical protein